MRRAIFAAMLLGVVGMCSGCRCFDNFFCGNGCASGQCGNCQPGFIGRLFGNHGCGIFGHPGCRACGGHGCNLCNGNGPNGEDGPAAGGPPGGQIVYPYYTTRGPRDFLSDNPRGIGP